MPLEKCKSHIDAVNRPIAYFNKALYKQVASESTYEKELLVLVLAIQHWRPYLLGKPFSIQTNQRSLKYKVNQQISTHDQHKW